MLSIVDYCLGEISLPVSQSFKIIKSKSQIKITTTDAQPTVVSIPLHNTFV